MLIGTDVLCCAVKSCSLANDCDLLAGFCEFLTPLMRGIPSSYRVHIWCRKIRMAGLQSGESRMMIDSVVWAQNVNVTHTHTHRQPRRHSKCRANALRRAAKNLDTKTSSTVLTHCS